MKKTLLLLCLASLVMVGNAVADTMNPFAYDLKSTYDEVHNKLTFEFKLNADAERIVVVATDHNGTEYVIEDYDPVDGPVERTDDHPFYCEASLGGKIPMGRDFTWRVDVYGEERTQATFVSNENKLYYPTSIDIDNNPENANFGTVFCIEGRGYKDANGEVITGNKYISSYNKNGAGLYIFNADGTPRPLPRKKNAGDDFGVDVERYGWNGGTNRNDPGQFIGQNKNLTGFGVFRVRVAEDGRIFITSMTPNGEVLHEANKNVFSDTVGTYWADRNWKRVMSSEYDATYLLGNKTIGSSNGVFYAGPNMGFDVRGAGDDLQLLMLSGNESALTNIVVSGFRCDEYNLGTNVRWEQRPSKAEYFTGYAITPDGSQVQYDKNGNVWMSQYRSYENQNNDYPTLMKFTRNQDGSVTPVIVDNPQVLYRRCGAIRFNKDFTKFAVASPGTTGMGGTISIYPVNQETGDPDFTKGKDIYVADNVGLSVMDLAWDYADNLYIAADHATGSGEDEGRCIGIYAMPRESNMVSTPAASKYAFSTRYHVKWDNLFVHGQDVEDEAYNYLSDRNELYDYTGLNHRLWKLVQVGFNNYRNSLYSTNKKSEVKDQWPTTAGTPGTHKIDLRVKDFFINNVDVTEEEVIGFFTNDTKFSWLGDYLSEVSGLALATKSDYVNNLDDFINRNGKFEEKGKPEYWRPLFVKHVLGLDDRVLFDEGMPINWQWTNQDELYFVELWVEGWHAIKHKADWLANNGYQYAALPSEWYYFNTIDNLNKAEEDGGMDAELSDLLHILAWRDGGVEGNIVHNVNRDSMVLYATYVAKNIDEDDLNPSCPLDFDASNDDVMQLMMNKKFGDDGEHTFTITRRLQAGMYNTICLPFDLDLDALPAANEVDRANHPLSGATAMAFNGLEPHNDAADPIMVLQFTEVRQLQAGVPYLIKVQDDIADDIEFYQVPKASMILPSQATSVTKGAITFHGTINPTEISKGSIILVADNRLAEASVSGELLGMRGYFTIDPSATDLLEQVAKGRIMLNFKQPVSTSVVVAPESEQSAVSIVRKVIQNNNIYILRGEEMYTIMGDRVR